MDGDQENAQQEFHQAERWFDEAGKTVEQARTAVFAARTLARLGRTAEAVAMLDRARPQAEACGALWVRDELVRVRELLTAPGAGAADTENAADLDGHITEGTPAGTARRPHGTRPTVAAPLSLLTDREREVARLIERGLTNRQIARALRLSERTVESHLGNVYRKLGVPTRAALAVVLGTESARDTAL